MVPLWLDLRKMLPCLTLGAFEDDDVTHVEGDVDPVRDLDVIFHELRAKDLEQLTKRLDVVSKQRDRDKQMKAEYVSCHEMYLYYIFTIIHEVY